MTVLAIDQGTTSSRTAIFTANLELATVAQRDVVRDYPRPGRVEQDPEDLWESVVSTTRQALAQANAAPATVAAIGITNQRETTLLWERATGKPVYPAIVWQDRRATPLCTRLRAQGCEPLIVQKTGLLLDSYFSAVKLMWLLDRDQALRRRATRGELAFGTVDTFLLWRLTGGKVHFTDATNAARTLLFDIHRGVWDDELLRLFSVPRAILPEVCDSAADFGVTVPGLFGGAIRIGGVAGDQQAAAIGQGCVDPGMIKATYGTGCFALLSTGAFAPVSQNRMLTTIACQIGGRRTYALEGSIFIAGAVVQWLRDGLGVLDSASESAALAATADAGQRVILVPAFTGLGAPYWDSHACGAIFGLTQATGRAELVRAALEAVCYQTRDLLMAMQEDLRDTGVRTASTLYVDGGMSANDWTMQFLADILDKPVERPKLTETTVLGAAWLAGLQAGIYPSPQDMPVRRRESTRFVPTMKEADREALYAGWQDAVRRTLTDDSKAPDHMA